MKEKLKTLAHYPAVFLFFAFIVVFSICDSFANDRKMSELENRQLSQKPALTMQNLFAANETEKKFQDEVSNLENSLNCLDDATLKEHKDYYTALNFLLKNLIAKF